MTSTVPVASSSAWSMLPTINGGRTTVGPNTVARLCRDILLTDSLSCTWDKNKGYFWTQIFFSRIIFSVLKSSETYAKKIISFFLREGGRGGKILAGFLAPVQEASIATGELFRFSEFCACLTDLLCLTTAPFSLFPNSRVDWHTLQLKLCLLAGSSNSHDWDMGSFFHTILKFVYFITCSEKLKSSILCYNKLKTYLTYYLL